uniref:Uncharacterized protein n=1 Tax=Rhizophora mucronata TaxID=61149 RepID=A0A2P2P0L6_RHIMU
MPELKKISCFFSSCNPASILWFITNTVDLQQSNEGKLSTSIP